ncbi:hypothetical protein ACFQYP_52925 [Nonomuraea antimicrobica]
MSESPRLHTAGTTLLERARDLRPLIEREAGAAEAQGMLTTPVVDALHEAGLFGVWVPEPLGEPNRPRGSCSTSSLSCRTPTPRRAGWSWPPRWRTARPARTWATTPSNASSPAPGCR